MSQEEHQTTVDEGTPQGALALPDQNLPQRVYLIPVRDRPFMPGLVQPLLLPSSMKLHSTRFGATVTRSDWK